MAEPILLTQDRVAYVSPEDAEFIGSFKWCVTNGYPARGVGAGGKKRCIYMHKVIAERMGFDGMVDHIDRDTLNNTRSNLRPATSSLNSSNVTPRSASGLLGVYQVGPNSWRAEVTRLGHRRRRAGFRTPEDALEWRAAQIKDFAVGY